MIDYHSIGVPCTEWFLNSSKSEDYEYYSGKETCGERLKALWNKIPAFKFFLMMGVLDGLGNILGLISYVKRPLFFKRLI